MRAENIPAKENNARKKLSDRLFKSSDGIAVVRSMNFDILTALVPIAAWAVYLYGLRVLTLLAISVASALIFDFIPVIILRDGKKSPSLDTVTASVITVLLLPVSSPLYLPIITSAISVIFVKHLFGRLCKIRLSGPAVAVCAAFLLFPKVLSAIPSNEAAFDPFALVQSGFETASDPLSLLVKWILPEGSLLSAFVGLRPGVMGACSALLILSGAIYLVARKVIKPHFALSFFASVFLCSALIFPHNAITVILTDTDALFEVLEFTFYHFVSGNILFCAVYLFSLPGGACQTARGNIVAGLIAGTICFFLRYFSVAPIDAVWSVLVINLLARPLDILLRPIPLGGVYSKRHQQISDQNDGEGQKDTSQALPAQSEAEACRNTANENSLFVSESGRGDTDRIDRSSFDFPDPFVHTRLELEKSSNCPSSENGREQSESSAKSPQGQGNDPAFISVNASQTGFFDEDTVFTARHIDESTDLGAAKD